MPRSLQLLLVLGLVLAANLLWDPLAEDAGERDSARRAKLPGVYIDDARSLSFTREGELADVLDAQRVEQFGRRGYALLSEPRFYSHSSGKNTWSAWAERGRYEPGMDRLLLRRNVVLNHDQAGTRLETSSLDVDLNTREAQTQRPVTITWDDNRTVAGGMLARLDAETIALGPDVESTYVPQP